MCNLYCKDKQSWQKIEHLSNAFIKVLRSTLGPGVRNDSDVLSETLEVSCCEEVHPSKEYNAIRNDEKHYSFSFMLNSIG